MFSHEPAWWYERPLDRRAVLLAPAGRAYGAMVAHRFQRRQPYRSRLPVICIGNLTFGGTGKTPLALLVAEHTIALGEAPVFLTRGYGGRERGPVWVDQQRHRARDVGDEALLLSCVAPVMVAADRRTGARAIERSGTAASLIIMDDGLQNPALRKDLSFVVVDAVRGIGNGEVFPAGPLRAPLDFQLDLAGAVIIVGRAAGGSEPLSSPVYEAMRQAFPGPVLNADAVPFAEIGWIKDATLLAYAGIGNPERFFDLLRSLGPATVIARTFPDHHMFRERDAALLLAVAEEHKAALITTEKDWIRLAGAKGRRGELQARSRTLPIRLTLPQTDGTRLAALVEAALKSGGYRAGMGGG